MAAIAAQIAAIENPDVRRAAAIAAAQGANDVVLFDVVLFLKTCNVYTGPQVFRPSADV